MDTSKALLGVLLIALIGIGALYTGVIQLPQQAGEPVTVTVPTPAPAQTTTGIYTGEINLNEDVYDAFDPATSYTSGTNYNIYWYAYRNGEWVNLGSNDVTGAEVTATDAGYVYVVLPVPPKSGQSYYWDVNKIDSLSERASYYGYQDVDGDGVSEYVFKYWIGDKQVTEAGNPSTTFIGYLRTYEKPSLSSPSDQTGVGTSETTIWIEWYESYTNTKRSTLVSKVELKYNSTDETKIKVAESAVHIPGLGYVSLSQFDYTEDGGNVIFTYTIGTDISTAIRQDYGTNQLNKFEYTAKLKIDLATGDQIGYTLTISHLDTTGSVTTNSDTVGVSAA